MKINPNLLGFVALSKRRREILSRLQKQTISQHELRKLTNMYKSHISRTLKELSERKLVLCVNPKDKAFKFYRITPLGKRTMKEVERIMD